MNKKKIIILLVSIFLLLDGLYYLGTNEGSNQGIQFDRSKKLAFEDKGDFKIIYGKTQNPRYAYLNEMIKKSGSFETLAVFLNEAFILPQDFPIILKECGFVNAYYDSKGKEIVMCDELLENLSQNFSYILNTKEEVDSAVSGAAFFILFHELGHGLINVYNLSYSGKEEDVADQLASVILTGLGENGPKAAITGANFFYITSSQVGEGTAFWDEHSLNQQRYYNILCWVYGSNPPKFNYFVGNYGLPQDRAARCQYEYKKMLEFWDTALAPYVKMQIKAGTN